MKRILVIEDEPEMRRNISTLLRYREYEPIEAENGRKGVDLARRAIERERCAVVVEGYFDVLAAHAAGVEHVVASSGTALARGGEPGAKVCPRMKTISWRTRFSGMRRMLR